MRRMMESMKSSLNRAQRLARRSGAMALVMGLAVLLQSCTQPITDQPLYDTAACKRIALLDTQNGAVITGAEDIAYDRLRSMLYVSAYDRRAVERAAKRKAFIIPEGGVYRVALNDLLHDDGRLVGAEPIVDRQSVAGGLRPHGVAYDESSGEIAFINRAYQKLNGAWRMTPRIERVGALGEVFVGRDMDAPCAANDLVANHDDHLISVDHGACGWRAGLEDVFGFAKSGVVNDQGASVFTSAKFANGVVRLPDGALALAGTRDMAVHILARDGDILKVAKRIDLPGGPDNLSVNDEGDIVAAVHPSLIRLALDRKLKIGRAPSRIVKTSPKTGKVTILIDDAEGEVFSAATVAVETPGVINGNRREKLLIAGSVTDAGLLVCRRDEAIPARVVATARVDPSR